ncbi:hypothetical protein F5887DRAFT_1002043 [Amanita rubescens]|nr:hypothetical protein F5887DRAFT_1002043 [Amanita rubescens]
MPFTAFGSIIALALVGVAAAAGVQTQNPNPNTPAQNQGSGKTTTNQNPNTGTTNDQCVQSACTCNGSPRNFCGTVGNPDNCIVGNLYTCQQDGKTCDLGQNDSCKN